MNRYVVTLTASLTLAGIAAPANAWPTRPPMTWQQAVDRVDHCAGNPLAGICTDPALTARAEAAVFAFTADNRHVAAICSAHRLNVHYWRMGFCRDVIYPASVPVAHDWSTDGVLERAGLLYGFTPA